MRKALLAFDKFKDALDAVTACETAAEAIASLSPETEVKQVPLSDGGEGFARILTSAVAGDLKTCRVSGPLFQPVDAHYGMVDIAKLPASVPDLLAIPRQGRLAVIEMAQAAGLEQLPADQRNPWHTSTQGVGELMLESIVDGADAILLGIGGSATNDLGVGALQALGLMFYDRELQPLEKMTPARWKLAATIGGTLKLAGKTPPVRIACDVSNPLLGEKGATRTFGPQKGLPQGEVETMERWVNKMARRLLGCFNTPWEAHDSALNHPGSGAAGGIAFGLRTALADVRLVSGFELFCEWCAVHSKLDWADTIFTGEGRADKGTLSGKGPGSLIQKSRKNQTVVFLAGRIDPEVQSQLSVAYPWVSCVELGSREWPLEKALRETRSQLAQKVREHILHP